MIKDPNYRIISIKYKQNILSYSSIMVTNICNVLVNKKPLIDEIYEAELISETFT